MTVIICTRDRTKGLRESLRSIQQVNYEPLEILVVDNAPTTDETRELVTALAEDDARIHTRASRILACPAPAITVWRERNST